MPFKDRPDTDRFFARIRTFDLECPRCGSVYIITEHTPATTFSKRTGRFCCPRCSLHLAVGVIVYPVTPGPSPQGPPTDWTPDPRQALALRQAISGHYAQPQDKKRWKDPHNVVIRENCTCQLAGRALIVHPACPVHSAAAKIGPPGPSPAAGDPPKIR